MGWRRAPYADLGRDLTHAEASSIARRGALVQQVNAVESVTNVDVVCTDKTGTLTTGHLTVAEVRPLGGDDVEPLLAAFARSVTSRV